MQSIMPSLALQLGETAPTSHLIRKARRFGIVGWNAFIELASIRGCDHYKPSAPQGIEDPGQEHISDTELVILLLLGENAYSPMAIRCAAQLARSPHVDAIQLANLAIRHKTSRVLSHIAHAALSHDAEGAAFWRILLQHLPASSHRTSEPHLPHWSRFVSMPGFQRNGPAPIRWLTPRL